MLSEVLEKGEWIKMRCGTYVERFVDGYFFSLHAQKEQIRATARACKLFCSEPIERRHIQKEKQRKERKKKEEKILPLEDFSFLSRVQFAYFAGKEGI